jgi:hypothetical protein
MKDKQYKWKCIFTDAILSELEVWDYNELVDYFIVIIQKRCNLVDRDKHYCLEVGKKINDFIQNMPSKEIARIPRVTICSNLSLCDNEFRIMERVKNVDCFDTDYNISDNIRVKTNPISPEHYKRLSPEPKDVIRSWGLNFNLGSAVKYISRAGHKDEIVQDLKKAQQFIQFEIDYLKGDKEQ